MAEYKKSGRARKLIVAGCMVERYRDQIRDQLPEVDALVGTNELAKIVARVRGLGAGQRSAGAVPLSRPDAARSRHRQPLRLYQDRRGLRPSLFLLRHPAVSRQVSQPAV